MTILSDDLKNVALTFYEGLDCPHSLTAALLLRYAEWGQLFNLVAEPRHYCTAYDFMKANAACTFLKKYEPRKPLPGVMQETIEKWFSCERQCFRTNRRLDELPYLASSSASFGRVYSILEQARKNLIEVIGYGPGNFESFARFGPGATVSDSACRSTIPHKMSSTPTFTRDAWPYLIPWTGTRWATACASRDDKPLCVKGNKFFTVPKTALSLRSCAKEPSLNVFFQLGLGRALRRVLRRWNIDLDNGQDFHRRVACAASISGSHATLDLSSASDTISSGLVKLLLPKGWFDALNDLRSPFTEIQGKQVVLEKFSSMGNGFTFELETAIFCSLLSAIPGVIIGKNTWVYGDDIIVPTHLARSAEALLVYCGFTLNTSKSFLEGPFRESCGGDFFLGVPVRGPYQKDDLDEPQKVISAANRIRRWGLQAYPTLAVDTRRSWFKCLDLLPSNLRALRGPEVLGDLVIHDETENWRFRWRKQIRWFPVYRPVNRGVVDWNRFDGQIQLASALYGVTLTGKDRVSGRSATGYKVGWVAFS